VLRDLRDKRAHNGTPPNSLSTWRQERVAGKQAHYAICELLYRTIRWCHSALGVDGTAHAIAAGPFFRPQRQCSGDDHRHRTTVQVSTAATELAAVIPIHC